MPTHRPGLCSEDVALAGQPRTDAAQHPSVPKDRQLFVDVEAQSAKTLRFVKIRYQRDHRGNHNYDCADDRKVFLKFIVRKMAHELPVIG